jgi:hypothetical protein
MRKILMAILFILAILAGYIYWMYFRVYSDGSRDGQLQKFSRKGNIFKTYEGELVQVSMRSLNTKVFYFSVTDQKIADSLEKLVGQEVKLHYSEYNKSLPWRGEDYTAVGATQNGDPTGGQYIVDRIDAVLQPNYYPQQGIMPQQQATLPQQAVSAPQQQTSTTIETIAQPVASPIPADSTK